MKAWLDKLFGRGNVTLSEASVRDAVTFSSLHGKSFHRGWSEHDIEQLLADRSVLAHRAMTGRAMAGFIMSRIAADEAEILTVAVDRARRGSGVARALLRLHLGRLAAFSIRDRLSGG